MIGSLPARLTAGRMVSWIPIGPEPGPDRMPARCRIMTWMIPGACPDDRPADARAGPDRPASWRLWSPGRGSARGSNTSSLPYLFSPLLFCPDSLLLTSSPTPGEPPKAGARRTEGLSTRTTHFSQFGHQVCLFCIRARHHLMLAKNFVVQITGRRFALTGISD